MYVANVLTYENQILKAQETESFSETD